MCSISLIEETQRRNRSGYVAVVGMPHLREVAQSPSPRLLSGPTLSACSAESVGRRITPDTASGGEAPCRPSCSRRRVAGHPALASFFENESVFVPGLLQRSL